MTRKGVERKMSLMTQDVEGLIRQAKVLVEQTKILRDETEKRIAESKQILVRIKSDSSWQVFPTAERVP